MVVSDAAIRCIEAFLAELYSIRAGGGSYSAVGKALAGAVPSDGYEFGSAEGVSSFTDRYVCCLPVSTGEGSAGSLVLSRVPGSHPPYSDEEIGILHFLISFVPLVFKEGPSGEGLLPVFYEKYGLTKKESMVAELVHRGFSNRGIAEKLGISEATVKRHVYNIFNKTGVCSRTQLLLAILSSRDGTPA